MTRDNLVDLRAERRRRRVPAAVNEDVQPEPGGNVVDLFTWLERSVEHHAPGGARRVH